MFPTCPERTLQDDPAGHRGSLGPAVAPGTTVWMHRKLRMGRSSPPKRRARDYGRSPSFVKRLLRRVASGGHLEVAGGQLPRTGWDALLYLALGAALALLNLADLVVTEGFAKELLDFKLQRLALGLLRAALSWPRPP